MDSGLYIGIDIGTSSVRCSAIDIRARLAASARTELAAPENPAPGCFEQKPELWWSATRACLTKLLAGIGSSRVRAIAVDGTSSTVLLTDGLNQPLGPALMYNDSRAAGILQQLKSFVPADSITLSASSSLAKAIHLLQQDNADNARYILHQADWISSRLSGKKAVSDENNCLKLGYDSIARQWPDWLKQAPCQLYEKLPAVYASGALVSLIDPTIASALNLSQDVQIISGTTDSTASTLATGVDAVGDAVTTYGTTLVTKIISDTPITSVDDGIYSHRLPSGQWLVGGASNSGGNVLLNYFSLEQIETLSSRIDPATSTGLDYYPLVAVGERFPINDPKLQPRLEPRPDSDVEFLQGIFEGFASIEKLAYDKMARLGAPIPSRIFSAGGRATKNRALTAIRARVLGIPLLEAEHTEASFGAALLARNAEQQIFS